MPDDSDPGVSVPAWAGPTVTRIVGITALLLALRLAALRQIPESWIDPLAEWMIALVAAAAFALVLGWLWLISRGTRASHALAWAFGTAVGYVLLSNVWPFVSSTTPALSALSNTLMLLALACGVVVPFALGLGLTRSPLVGPWVGWVATAWGASWILGLTVNVSWITLGLNVLFFLGLGIALLRPQPPTARRTSVST